MTGSDAYVQVGNVTLRTGEVLVENVNISRESLALLLLEEQIEALHRNMSKRRRQIAALEEQQRNDQNQMNLFIRAVDELRKSRPY